MGHLSVIDLNLLMLLWHSPGGSVRARLLLIESLEMLLFTHGGAGTVQTLLSKPRRGFSLQEKSSPITC